MKAIISHDIDHLTFWEHKADLIIPKSIVRSAIETVLGKIPTTEFANRVGEVFSNKMQYIEELMLFNKSKNIPATFFIGMDNELGLSYSRAQAAVWIKSILKNGFDVGVHGIGYSSAERLKSEWNYFKELSGTSDFGVRMHYLRQDDNTLERLAGCGFLFDATVYKDAAPYRIGQMWEFPLQIMDAYEMSVNASYQNRKVSEVVKSTKSKIDVLLRSDLPYLNLLFHDRYYGKAHQSWKIWYEECIEYLVVKGITFVNYKQAIRELEGRN